MDNLKNTIKSVIDEGRLGDPKFLRCVLQVSDDIKSLRSSIEILEELAQYWFDDAFVKRHRIGNENSSYIGEILRWDGGQGALIVVNLAQSVSKRYFDLMLVGSKGTLYHESE